MEEEYVREKSANSTEIDPVQLIGVFDSQGDEVSVDFLCFNCFNEINLSFNETENEVQIPYETPLGTYRVQLTLTDDNVYDPLSKKYEFDIRVKQAVEIGEFIPTYVETIEEEEQEGEKPSFKLESLTNVGELEVTFTH